MKAKDKLIVESHENVPFNNIETFPACILYHSSIVSVYSIVAA